MDISFSSIFGVAKAVGSFFKEMVEKALFYRAYKISTLHHNHRQLLGRFARNLTSGLKYDIHWEKYYLQERKSSPMIWIVAESDKKFSKLVLSVTASNRKIKYQDTVTFHDVDSIPLQAALPSIPFRNIRIEGNRVYTSYDAISLKIVELRDSDGQVINLFGDGTINLHPCDNLEVTMGLERGDVEKWGEVFNLQFLEGEIREEKIRFSGRLHSCSRLTYYLINFILSQGWILKTNFWRKNLFIAKQLTIEFLKYLQEQKELDQWRAEKSNFQLPRE
jgi:hypothetical protein